MLPDHLNYEYSPGHYMREHQQLAQQQQYATNKDLQHALPASMIRSNSTQGTFMPQSPLLARLSPRGNSQQRSDRERRGSAKESSHGSAATTAVNHHSIAHLDFPPPPSDLPPPPDDFLEDINTGVSIDFPPPPDSDLMQSSSPEPRLKLMSNKPIPSPRSRRRELNSHPVKSSSRSDKFENQLQPSTPLKSDDNANSPQPERAPFAVTRRRLRDLDGKKPPVKAKPHLDQTQDGVDGAVDGNPASRFGVSLRHRDQSSDSCDSVKSGENLSPRSGLGGSKSNWSLTRSPGSSSADTVDTSPSPSNYADKNSGSLTNDSHDATLTSAAFQRDLNSIGSYSSNDNLDARESLPNSSQAGQLVSELFESLRQKTGPPPPDNGSVKARNNLAPSNQNKSSKDKSESPGSFVFNLKKTKSSTDKSDDAGASNLDFKSKLRKTEVSKPGAEPAPTEADSHIVDFRSQLKRAHHSKEDLKGPSCSNDLGSNTNCYSSHVHEEQNNYDDGKMSENVVTNSGDHNSIDSCKRDSANSDSLKMDDDPKRFSSSSISNLKKLWEKEEREGLAATKSDVPDTSPKYAPGLYKKLEGFKEATKVSPDDSSKPGKSEKQRVWPPLHRSDDLPPAMNRPHGDSKPLVPTKPSGVKNLRPPPPSGGGVKLPPPKPAGIYATPSFITQACKKDKDGNKISKSSVDSKSKSRAEGKDSESKKKSKVYSFQTRNNGENNGNEADSDSGGAPERSRMLEETKAIEEVVKSTLHSDLPLSSTACIQLVLRLEQFRVWCDGYVDHLPPQSRFQVREMLVLLDKEVHQLRVKGGGRSPDHYGMVGAKSGKPPCQFPVLVSTVKDICNTLRR